MVSKSIDILKKNSVLILFYAAYMVAMFLIVFMLYPKDMSQFSNTDPATFDFAIFRNIMLKMLLASLLMGIAGLSFFSGFGSMISEAVLNGKTFAASFLPGLKKFFVRVLLATLLLSAFYIGFSIVLSIILIPITIITVISGAANPAATDYVATGNLIGLITASISAVAVIFSFPFIISWYSSIFIDDTGVIQGLKNGAKSSVKNYWKLVLVILTMYLPIVTYMIINFASMTKGVIFTPGYLVVCILAAIISIVALPIIFMIYKENKPILIEQ